MTCPAPDPSPCTDQTPCLSCPRADVKWEYSRERGWHESEEPECG